MSLYAELKRRNVFRVGAAYLVVGWLLLQVSDVVLGFIGAPEWVGKALIALLLLGLVPSLAVAWIFEVGPHGIKRDDGLSPDAAGTRARRLDYITLLALVVVAHMVLFEQLRVPKPEKTTGETRSESKAAEQGTGAGKAGTSAAREPAERKRDSTVPDPVAVPQSSVAVLPFTNMSADPEQAYFSDGISEELLNALVKLPGLKVAGRTSSFTYRDGRTNLRDIGKALGVAHVLEGSVRRQGDRVRITAQLIKAEDGFHLWSETYDREVGDIFALQDEIADAIVAALQVKLGTAHAPVATANLEAYNLYLQARQRLALRGLDNLLAARDLFERSLALDPKYAPAHAGLGRTLTLVQSYSEEAGRRQVSGAEISRLAKAAAQRALALDPRNAEAWSVIGVTAMWFDWDWAAASDAMERALALAPADAEVVNFLGDFYNRTLDPRAVETEMRAVELDPLHAVNHADLALPYLVRGDYEQALAAATAAEAMGLFRESPDVMVTTLVPALLGLGRIEEARAVVARVEASPAARSSVVAAKLDVARVAGDEAAIADLLPQLLEMARSGAFSATRMGSLLVGVGQPKAAAEWFERAYDAHEYALPAPRLLLLPERLPAEPTLQAALAKPELEALFALRRENLAKAADRGADPP